MSENVKKQQILLNIDPELKRVFKKRCLELGLKMTDVLLSSIKDFINESNKND